MTVTILAMRVPSVRRRRGVRFVPGCIGQLLGAGIVMTLVLGCRMLMLGGTVVVVMIMAMVRVSMVPVVAMVMMGMAVVTMAVGCCVLRMIEPKQVQREHEGLQHKPEQACDDPSSTPTGFSEAFAHVHSLESRSQTAQTTRRGPETHNLGHVASSTDRKPGSETDQGAAALIFSSSELAGAA